MTNPYTSQTLSGFNSSPPPNDATTGSDNEADWDGQIIGKVGTPLKNFTEAINAAITAAFANLQLKPFSYLVPTLNHISGLTFSNGSDADHDMDFTVGEASDETQVSLIQLTSALTKQFDATFAEGTNQGGMISGDSLPTSGQVNFWLIEKTDGTTDICGNDHSNEGLSPTLPSGFTYKRRIGFGRTDGSANFLAGTFTEEAGGSLRCEYTSPNTDVNGVTISTTPVTPTLTVPAGIRLKALIRAAVTNAVGGSDIAIGSTDETLAVATANRSLTANSAGAAASGNFEVLTNTSGQIQVVAGGASTVYYISTYGFIDFRRS